MDSTLLSSQTISRQIQSKPFRLAPGLNPHISSSSPLQIPTSPVRSARFPRLRGVIRASLSERERRLPTSSWEDKPYDLLPGGRKAYIDEQDVACFLDPPKDLVPIDPASYNPAAYLWKKIADIPEERRQRLLYMLKARLIPRIWEVAGTRYEDQKLAKQSASPLLCMEKDSIKLEYWDCRTSKGPLPISWMNGFKKAIFRGNDGIIYGRILLSEAIPASLRSFSRPLYFRVKQVTEVISTEEPCDLAYEFGDGLFDIEEFPEGFPKPEKHPWPFNDDLVIYIRHVGPGVLVGQAWQEGKDLDQVPRKFCGEILMMKEYASAYGA